MLTKYKAYIFVKIVKNFNKRASHFNISITVVMQYVKC